MADLLPSTAEFEPPDGEPRVLGVDSDDADAVLGALSSTTARDILAVLHEEPSTPSELASAVDTSLQNAQYHLRKLEDTNLIEVCGTRYSSKGREMNIYAPTDAPLVLFAGTETQSRSLRSALTRLLGAVGILGLASLVVQVVVGDGLLSGPDRSGGADGGDAGVMGTADATPTAAVESAGAAEAALGLPPGLLFFLGGALVLALAVGWWYLSASHDS